MSETYQKYESQSMYPSGPIEPCYTSSHRIDINWPSYKIARLPMIYQLCLVLFCSGVFLFGLAKLIEVFKP